MNCRGTLYLIFSYSLDLQYKFLKLCHSSGVISIGEVKLKDFLCISNIKAKTIFHLEEVL